MLKNKKLLVIILIVIISLAIIAYLWFHNVQNAVDPVAADDTAQELVEGADEGSPENGQSGL